MSKLDEAYWTSRYQSNQTGWNVGHPTPPLVDYTIAVVSKESSILIPGAGKGHEAFHLSKIGFKNITVCDLSEEPLTFIKNKDSTNTIKTIKGDFFELNKQFDLILEQTFFCALNPKSRIKYVDKMYELLNPSGILAGVLFNRTFDKKGPPFGGSKEEYINLFSNKFEIIHLENCYNSIPSRSGSEVFIEFRKQ
jgi:SAM-dependent methyltransferase